VPDYDRPRLRSELSRDEGRERFPYRDTEGILTIGVGWNLEANGLPEHLIDELLDIGIRAAESDLDVLMPGWREHLSAVRQRVLLNMAFNLGRVRLAGFRQMWQAIREQNWAEAAIQMLDSKWARQVGPRAARLAEMMRLGVA